MAGRSAAQVDQPPADSRFKLGGGLVASVISIWDARTMLLALAGRQLRVRYKHTALGYVWAIVSIGLPLVVLLVIRRHLVGSLTEHVSGFVFVAVGLIPWSFFSSSLNDAASSLVAESSIVTRISGDRAIFPLSRLLVATRRRQSRRVCHRSRRRSARHELRIDVSALVVIPLMVVVAVCAAAGWALILSVVVVRARDARHICTIVLQFGLFLTPVMYGLDSIPESVRLAYVAINPIAGVIDSLRAELAFGTGPNWTVVGVALLSSVVVLVVGLKVFRHQIPGVIDLA